MPPKRARVAPKAPAVAPLTDPTQAPTRSTRSTRARPNDSSALPAPRALSTEKAVPRSGAKRQPARKAQEAAETAQGSEVDDDEDVTGGLVRHASGRGTKRRHRHPDAFVAGGLGSPDRGDKVNPPPASTEAGHDEYDVPATQGGDTTSASAKSKGKNTVAQSPAARRKTATPAKSATPRSKEAVPRKTGFTPLAADSSVQALQMFRRRPRQLSLLAAVRNGQLDTSVLDATDSLLGDSGEELGSSALDTTVDMLESPQVAGSLAIEEQDGGDFAFDGDLGDSMVDDEAFRPDMEGTPLPGRRGDMNHAERLNALYDDDDDLYTVSPRKQRGTKRKSDEISSGHADSAIASQLPGTQRTEGGALVEVMRSSPPVEDAGGVEARSSDLSSARSPSTPPYDIARSSSPRRYDLDSETYADPRSSSPTTDEVDVVSPAKNRRGDGSAKARQDQKMTSAMLRELLPRRLVKRDESFDVSGMESEDEDRPAKKTRRKVLAEVKGKKNSKVVVTKGARKAKPRLTMREEEKENAGAIGVHPKSKEKRTLHGAKTSSRTYGRDRGERSDAHDSEDSKTELQSRELQAAKDKFRQIDQGSLEFDSASIISGSSPWR